jgi:hypothetical protein
MRRAVFLIIISLQIFPGVIQAQKPSSDPVKSIEEFVRGVKQSNGFFSYYYDDRQGRIYLEVDELEEEFLMTSYLSRGMGSNDVGLDRGKIGASRPVKFQRNGNKILLIEPNYSFRAQSDDALEIKAVEESFATSVIWGFEVMAETRGRILIDITDFILSDQNYVGQNMKSKGQGNYVPDQSRSALNMERTKNFPDNTEFDVILTFTGEPMGNYVFQVVPSAEQMTVGQHISFVRLPKLGDYKPRAYHPGSGLFFIRYMDLASPLGEPLTKMLICRHKLEKKDPAAASSEAVEPIIYYLDPGTPEPMRSALLEGASWWNEAFKAIGYKNAFQVRLLPEDADPLDIRYNVIQWVHRSTRGWSYGSTIVDPRTGEILKGHVSLGSQRVRQDYMIAEALLSPYTEAGKGTDEMQEMSLARLRQLSAHELGHTLGFMHNYTASADQMSSVMDYPHPLVDLDNNGSISLAGAYDTRIGVWDKVSVQYGYQDFKQGKDEAEELQGILNRARESGLRYLSDRDARPQGSAHPHNHLWDNGEDAVAELEKVMKIRQKALQQFSESNISEGVPMSELEDLLVPAYMFHRYQLEAAVKTIGGLNYNYAVKGEELILEMLAPSVQKNCLETVLKTIEPGFLGISEDILSLIPPKPAGYVRDRENFESRTGLTFDPFAAVESSADLTIGLLLNPQRTTRLVEHHARDPKQPGLDYVLERLIEHSWKSMPDESYEAEIQRVVNNLVLNHLIRLASDRSAGTQARAIAWFQLEGLQTWLKENSTRTEDNSWKAHFQYAGSQIEFFLENPDQFEHESPLEAPPGQPIGDCGMIHLN